MRGISTLRAIRESEPLGQRRYERSIVGIPSSGGVLVARDQPESLGELAEGSVVIADRDLGHLRPMLGSLPIARCHTTPGSADAPGTITGSHGHLSSV